MNSVPWSVCNSSTGKGKKASTLWAKSTNSPNTVPDTPIPSVTWCSHLPHYWCIPGRAQGDRSRRLWAYIWHSGELSALDSSSGGGFFGRSFTT